MKRHFIMATAGHVDHGKSALVKALTGVDPDRLPEEKARGITIELGFAQLHLHSKMSEICLGIVDVPGHEDFVRNMAAGVACINLGLIVVAANDGWMPQTEEHLQLLEYLGVKRVIIALNKIDLMPKDEDFLKEVIADELSNSIYSNAILVPTSAQTGAGIDALKSSIARELEQMPAPRNVSKPRLFVDRAFSVKGHGTVVTGTLIEGVFELHQSVSIQPRGIISRIRSLQSFGKDVASVQPGSRVAMNLAGVSVEKNGMTSQSTVRRGDVVTMPETNCSTRVIDCIVSKSRRLRGKNIPAAKALKHGTRIHLHHGTGNTSGRIFFLDKTALEAGTTLPAQIRLEGEAMLLAGDRFALRDGSQNHTLGGGWIVDPFAVSRHFRKPEQRRFLLACAAESVSCESLAEAIVKREKICKEKGLLQKSAYGKAEIEEVIVKLKTQNRILRKGGWVFDFAFWQEQIKAAKALIDAWHKLHCELLGMPLPRLRAELDPRWRAGDAFVILLKTLDNEGFVMDSKIVRRAAHRISLPADLEIAVKQIRKTLNEKPMEPPARKQLLQSDQDVRALRFLIDRGELVEIGDCVFLKEGWQRLRGLVRRYLEEHGKGTVSELRQFTSLSRRIMLPVLEALDADGSTIREGDLRKWKPNSD